MEKLNNNQDENYGIERPHLEYQQHKSKDGTIVLSLTRESEIKWSKYLRDVGLAKIAMSSMIELEDK